MRLITDRMDGYDYSRSLRVRGLFPAYGFLKGDAQGAVGNTDRPAVPETVFADLVKHGGVVPVGIDADIADPALAESKRCLKDPFPFAAGSDPVDGSVRLIVRPAGTIPDLRVGGGRADDKGKNARDLSVLFDDVTGFILKIPEDQGKLRRSIAPLGGVAGSAHELTGMGIDLLNFRQIFRGTVSDQHLSNFSCMNFTAAKPGPICRSYSKVRKKHLTG